MNRNQAMNLSTEDAVQQGYLVIVRKGNLTVYAPTAKYRATMIDDEEDTVIETSRGVFVKRGSDVKLLHSGGVAADIKVQFVKG